jgi:glycosyltransferase involved in cell wall biosynthesis
MKRIIFVIPSMANAGGAESLVSNLSSLLKEFYDVRIVSFDPIGTTSYFPLTVPFYPLGQGPKLPLVFRTFTYFSLAWRLYLTKRRLSVDISISVLWRADLINSLSRGREKIISLVVINFLGNPSNVRMIQLRFFVSFIFRRFDKILAITRQVSKEFNSLFCQDSGEVGVFRTFLPSPNSTNIFLAPRNRFVFCGRAVAEKNIEGLLAVFERSVRRDPDLQLVIIGDGPSLGDMRSLAVRYGLTIGRDYRSTAQVLFVGTVDNPQDYMVGGCAFLMTSVHEGLPTVAILAASLGLPMLVADCKGGGMRDFFQLPDDEPDIEQSGTGLKVPSGLLLPIPSRSEPGTLEVWARALIEAATNDTLRRERVQGALELAFSYSPQAVLKEWRGVIEEVATT